MPVFEVVSDSDGTGCESGATECVLGEAYTIRLVLKLLLTYLITYSITYLLNYLFTYVLT